MECSCSMLGGERGWVLSLFATAGRSAPLLFQLCDIPARSFEILAWRCSPPIYDENQNQNQNQDQDRDLTMEDAPEDDRDVKLQKASSDLIADFDRSLTPFLRKPNGELRTRVRISETARLTSTLLDPFQELPQLLDPHLPKWLPVLAASYLENLYTQAGRLTRPSSAAPSARAQLLEPLPAAIARLVYTLTKIRGAAVILRFLPVEARHLEPLLAALESAERRAARPSLLALTDSVRAHAAAAEPSQRDWDLGGALSRALWLAQLLLAPFDLSTISSATRRRPAPPPSCAARLYCPGPARHHTRVLPCCQALSVITLKLNPDMADEVVDAVLDALNRNVLWAVSAIGTAEPVRDLSAVDPLEWHGLTLTLSHLLYRRSPPARQLPAIIAALLLALAFEKRSTSGSSVGANVRDAACFGIWALARRYTTAELLAVPTGETTSFSSSSSSSSFPPSILQRLATELTVTASLDPAGNIRRGASAALQELIGRHPDTVDKGIWLVQTVDYHAVALRARALHEGALKAAKLSPVYGRALLRGLLDWRGVGDPDAGARRVAGASFGTLTRELSSGQEKKRTQFQVSAKMVLERLSGLQNRQVEERHGLLLCLASVLDKFPSLVGAPEDGLSADDVSVAQRVVREGTDILQGGQPGRPTVVQNSLLEAANRSSSLRCPAPPGFEIVSPDSTQDLLQIVAAVDALPEIPSQVKALVRHFEATISAGLSRPEKSAIAAAAEAALVLLAFSEPAERNRIVTQWAATTRQKPTSRTTSDHGYFAALTMAHPLTTTATRGCTSDTADTPESDMTTDAILSRWASDKDIDTRVAILQSLTESVVLQDGAPAFLDLLAQGLNDYTTTARGDVGSHVRLGALRATRCIWRSLQSGGSTRQQECLRAAVSKLYLNVLRLATEKLDRVRTEAQAVLSLTLTPSYAVWFNKLTFSSRTYLLALLTLYAQDEYIHPLIMEQARADPGAWMAELLAGYVTSADTGNEDLVIAARAALTEYCSIAPANRDDVCIALVRNLSSRQGQDRVLVPTLEIVAFLYRAGLFAGCRGVDPKRLCLLVQKAGYKTGSIRKLEACIHVYGCVAMFEDHAEAAAREARKRLGALMFHPWPRVRSLVVDELWQLFCNDEAGSRLKSVDWGRADKGAIRSVVSVLGLA
ncbi:conserved hypothetical protein [Verticillium alfalfae VaMs.102]|uniref:Uncharacterized protein n=1 Tax=Verticillium alfalfae (strain VaMs.102 / ATCC MYA-4576 / FGSC 10136) TaxID=526221 RepID=C9S8Z8_VERA1|nr:conserved hypothetical protein [Verticillium alfalfae VaMs.102]EEY14971.1 conserved hypothetical protein [Verticillium alfalfae VaMs.102]